MAFHSAVTAASADVVDDAVQFVLVDDGVDGHRLAAGDLHHGRGVHAGQGVTDAVQPVLGDVHHQVAFPLGVEHGPESGADLLGLRVVDHVRAGEQSRRGGEHLLDHGEAVDL